MSNEINRVGCKIRSALYIIYESVLCTKFVVKEIDHTIGTHYIDYNREENLNPFSDYVTESNRGRLTFSHRIRLLLPLILNRQLNSLVNSVCGTREIALHFFFFFLNRLSTHHQLDDL